jgi:hypothetical protein
VSPLIKVAPLNQNSSLLINSIRTEKELAWPDNNLKALICNKNICGVFYKCLILYMITFGMFYMKLLKLIIPQHDEDLDTKFMVLGSTFAVGVIASGYLNLQDN